MPKFRVPIRRVTEGFIIIEATTANDAVDALMKMEAKEYKSTFVADKDSSDDYIESMASIDDIEKFVEN